MLKHSQFIFLNLCHLESKSGGLQQFSVANLHLIYKHHNYCDANENEELRSVLKSFLCITGHLLTCRRLFILSLPNYSRYIYSTQTSIETNTFIQPVCIVLIKSDSKDIYNVTKSQRNISNKCSFVVVKMFFWTFYSSVNPKK